jgi:hypothetical protein
MYKAKKCYWTLSDIIWNLEVSETVICIISHEYCVYFEQQSRISEPD